MTVLLVIQLLVTAASMPLQTVDLTTDLVLTVLEMEMLLPPIMPAATVVKVKPSY